MPVSWADELTTGALPLYVSTRVRRAKARFLSGRQSHPARVRSNWLAIVARKEVDEIVEAYDGRRHV
jgi:hypothetical protein